MKTTNFTIKLITVITLLFYFTNNFAAESLKDTVSFRTRKINCLEINGRLAKHHRSTSDFYTVILVKGNDVVQSITKKDSESFDFTLEEGAFYAIKIIKDGYAQKLISIDTKINRRNLMEWRYKLIFKAELVSEKEYLALDKDTQDFPSAIIRFSNQINCFDYSKEYTKNIKHSLYSGIKSKGQIASNN